MTEKYPAIEKIMLSSETELPSLSPPRRMIHALRLKSQRSIVPIEQTDALRAALLEIGFEQVTIPNKSS